MKSLLLSLLLAQTPEAATPVAPRFVPSVGVAVASYGERLTVDGEGDTRRLLTSSLVLGLEYRLWDGALDFAVIEGVSTVGLGLVFHHGQAPLQLEQTLRLARTWGWLQASGGLAVGLSVNLGDPTYSFATLALPLGVRLGPVELIYAPRLDLPLGRDEAAVYGGARRQAVALGLSPLNLQVRFRFEGLGFSP
jgi:hypothetical protein